MLKGTQKQIIYLKDTKSGIFDEAYFVIKPSGVSTLSRSDMVQEANRIISSHTIHAADKKTESTKKKNTRPLGYFILGAVSGAVLSVAVYFILYMH